MCSSLSQGKHTPENTDPVLADIKPWTVSILDTRFSLFSRGKESSCQLHSSSCCTHQSSAQGGSGLVPLTLASQGLEITTWWTLLKQSMASASPCTAGIQGPYNHPHSWHHFCLPIEAGSVEAIALAGGSGNACNAFWFSASLEIIRECMSRAAHMQQQARHEHTPGTHIWNDVDG